MKRRTPFFLLIALALLFTVGPVDAQTKLKSRAPAKAKRSSDSARKKGAFAVVIAEETQIYLKPDLDSQIVATARQGTKIPVSKGTRGDYAKFFRTRVAGKEGWVLTIDVKSQAEAKKVFTKAKAAEYKPGPFAEQPGEKESEGKGNEPFAFSRSVSFVVGMNDYKESINGADRTANLLSYGLKLTGPDVLLTGPLMDVNLMLHYGAPEYYNALSAVKPSGFIMWADANLLLPIMARENFLIGVGAGPLLVISNIQAIQGNENRNMWQMNVGADIELTGGIRFRDFCVRLEGKYFFEKKTYRQVQLALGTVF